MKKRTQRVFPLLLFGLGLAIGSWLGYYFGNWVPQQIESENDRQQVNIGEGQRSYLVVGVDRVGTTRARLQGVWFVTYRPNISEIWLIPLYPSADKRGTNWNESLELAFSFSADGGLDPQFSQTLESTYNFEWDDHILIDDIAIMEIVDFLGGLESGLDGPQAVGKIPPAWEDHQAALVGQTALLQNLCEKLTEESKREPLDPLLRLIPDHILLPFDIQQAVDDWRQLTRGPGPLKCNIP